MESKKQAESTLSCEYEGTVSFEEGLFGFEKYKRFLPIPVEEDSDAVLTLLSMEDKDLAFIIMNPFLLDADYHPEVEAEELRSLGEAADTEYSWYVICTAHQPAEESTVNMKCPIVVNVRTRKAKQIILRNEGYTFRHRLGDLTQKEKQTC